MAVNTSRKRHSFRARQTGKWDAFNYAMSKLVKNTDIFIPDPPPSIPTVTNKKCIIVSKC